MKKLITILIALFTVSMLISQEAPCCKNKQPGTKCPHSAKVIQDENATDVKDLPACCKAKAAKGLSCCKTAKQDGTSCNSDQKQWWKFWKKGCDKPCCNKSKS